MHAQDHRLSVTIAPRAYRIFFEIDPDADTFSGRVNIAVDALADTAEVTCHSMELDIVETLIDGISAPHRLDGTLERLTIEAPVSSGRHDVEISFRGPLTDRLVGLYRAVHTRPDGTTGAMAVTQMEAAHARKVFPCWDEPDFKATFEITIRSPKNFEVLSNSLVVETTDAGDGWIEHRHAPTMPLSTYLVAVVVGELETGATATSRGISIRVLHTPGSKDLANFAAAVASHAVAWFEDYFGLAFPAPKLDLVGVPDFSFGAMENHGCVTFREAALLVDPTSATPSELERVATIVSHEIAHMWFGNLVTMEWWDGIWLNEAFATFMELCCADAFEPTWDVWQRSNLGVCHALDTDALSSTRPIEYRVETPLDADDMFDSLTYEKGSAVVRMIEGYLGTDPFRAGVRRYLTEHRLANTTTDDLWAALEAETGEPTARIAATWIRQGGHPVIAVRPTERGIAVSQRAFRYDGHDERQWFVPIAGTAMVEGREVVVRGLLDGGSLEIDLGGRPSEVRINHGRIGCYRVDFDDELLGNLDAHQPSELLALVDDVWAAVLAGSAETSTLLTLMDRVATCAAGDDATLWRRMAAVVQALVNASGSQREGARRFARELAAPDRRNRFGTETDAVALTVAGTHGRDPELVERAAKEWDQTDLDPAIATAMLSIATTNGDAEHLEALLDRYRHDADPQRLSRIVNAIGQVGDPALAERAVDAALTVVRSQNASTVLATLLNNAPVADNAWSAMERRWDELLERVPASHHDRALGGMRGVFDEALASRISAVLDTASLGGRSLPIRQHRERMEVNVAAAPRIREEFAVHWGT